MPEAFLAGLGAALHPAVLGWILAGLLVGFAVGVLPGLSRSTAIAVSIPLSFYLPPVAAISFLIGIAKGGATGGAVTAILINTPGEPSSAATCLDGYPLARQGKAGKALKASLVGSVFGDLLSTAVLILLAVPLASLALRVGPFEMAALLVFALTFIAALSGESMTKGLIAGALGLLVACVGVDVETGAPRLAFGMVELYDGIPLLALAIGMLAVAEMVQQIEAPEAGGQRISPAGAANGDRLTGADLRRCAPTYLRSGLIGVVIGIIPGLGASVASFLAYGVARRTSATPDLFGKGALEGVAAAETADNAVIPASLIPLFALGIPGSVVAAMLIGAFTIHGVQPGPQMFEQHADLVGGVFGGMVVAALLLLPLGWLLLRPFARLAEVPDRWVVPPVLCLCLAGALLEGSGMVTVWLMLGFALLAYVMRRTGFPVVCFLVGFLVGPALERAIRQSVALADGNPAILLERPIALGILALAGLAAWWFARSHLRLRRLSASEAQG